MIIVHLLGIAGLNNSLGTVVFYAGLVRPIEG